MNEAELAAVVHDLQRLVGTSVSGLWQPARDRVVLGLGDRGYLLLVPRGPMARMHTIDRRPRNPPRPFSFQGAGRARLRGPLVSLEKVPGDRIARLSFPTSALEIRLTGRTGGLWLLDHTSAVVAAFDGPAPDALPSVGVRPIRHDPVRFDAVDGSADLGARRFFVELERDHMARERRVTLERRLKRAIQRNQRLRVNLEGDLERAEEAPALRRRADLLAAHLHRVSRGDPSITVDDWETGVPVTIELDPARPPSDVLQQLYRRASRLDRVGDRVLERLDATESELRWLERSLRDLPTADIEALTELDSKLPKLPGGPRGRSDEPLPWSIWVGPQGQRVLVGRNERGNRRLTFQVARGTDWWMHVRERPGAHLILPMGSDQTPTLDHLLAAAQIAVLHARVPEGDAADVQYARVRDVRSIPGEIGRVRIAAERVLRVTREPAGLVGWVREEVATPGVRARR